MSTRCTAILFLFLMLSLGAASVMAGNSSSILPDGEDYDPAVPTPESVLGFGPGERHVRPDMLVRYLERVAAVSDRVRLEVTGRTHEDRPLLLLTITDPERWSHIDQIRERHRSLSDPKSGATVEPEMPAVVWLGYSVHGNEASGSNAVPWVVYQLAASRTEEWTRRLRDLIVLIDPSLNPDGQGRFSSWVNANRGKRPVSDPATREHRETWPGGRTNHYWFDLNRDWLPLVQPESRARVGLFHRWKPNVLADFHEMGSDSTYFFQPGVPSRQHPLTPDRNLELTRKIADYHAAALDGVGQSYFTEEIFDDFYYGKGSTYPDVNGGVGILFEQASARGHVQETATGLLTFARAVRNQFLTSLSTLRATSDLREELLTYQREFYRSAVAQAAKSRVGGYVFGDSNVDRVEALVDVLRFHEIEVMALAEDVDVGGETFRVGNAYAVGSAQPQSRLLEALFETRREFADATFYDVSAWNMAMAYDVPLRELSPTAFGKLRTTAETNRPPIQTVVESKVGYAFDWTPDAAPPAVQELLDAGLHLRYATRPFVTPCTEGDREYPPGSLVIPVGDQPMSAAAVLGHAQRLASDRGLTVCSVRSGLSSEGPDLGSPSLRPLQPPRPVLLVGDGVSAYEAGELWHLTDQVLGLQVTQVSSDEIRADTLLDATHLLLAEGSRALKEDVEKRIHDWVRGGGVLIATRSTAAWIQASELFDLDGKQVQKPTESPASPAVDAPIDRRPFGEMEADRAKQVIGGAIFEVELDRTHPMAYGYTRNRLAVFRSDARVLPLASDPYATFARYTDEPLLSGYSSSENRMKIGGSAMGRAHRVGRGAVILLADNPAFRGFWRGTERLWINGLYFADAIRNGPPAPAN